MRATAEAQGDKVREVTVGGYGAVAAHGTLYV
jgi:hypothetical protein